MKELAPLISAAGTKTRRYILSWRIKDVKLILYAVVAIASFVTLMAGGMKLYALMDTNPKDKGVTLTLSNGQVVSIPVSLGASFVQVNTDSILFTVKSNTGFDCKGILELKVAAGMPPAITRLSDGTLVHVNVSSSIQYNACFTGNQRDVTLEGEAYFEVSQNAQQPFVVHTKDMVVNVLGTTLNINSYADNAKAQVSLLEGNVLIHIKQKEIGMHNGQMLTYDRSNGQTLTGIADKRIAAWRNGIYFFDGESLATICKQVGRMYGNTIIIDCKELANRHFSGSVNRKQPLTTFLNYIRDIGSVDYYNTKQKQLHLRCLIN